MGGLIYIALPILLIVGLLSLLKTAWLEQLNKGLNKDSHNSTKNVAVFYENSFIMEHMDLAPTIQSWGFMDYDFINFTDSGE